MSGQERDPGLEWERGWEGHREAQRRRLAQLPLTEKLRWLEEADRIVRHLGRAAERRDAPGSKPDRG